MMCAAWNTLITILLLGVWKVEEGGRRWTGGWRMGEGGGEGRVEERGGWR